MRLPRGDHRGIWEFATAILHGDQAHKDWLLDAAEAFVAGKSVPKPPKLTGDEIVRRFAPRGACTSAIGDARLRATGSEFLGFDRLRRNWLRITHPRPLASKAAEMQGFVRSRSSEPTHHLTHTTAA
jgi:hypothetical protein